MLSTKVCKECHNKLATFFCFKQDLVNKQEKLYQMLEEAKLTEQIEELHEDPTLGFDDLKSSKLEPEVNIKTEFAYEHLKMSEIFEPIDYDDVHSGEFCAIIR